MRIEFEFESKYGTYRDALYLPDDHTFTQEEIVQMQTDRLNNWMYVIENPLAPEPEIIMIDGVNYEKVDIGGQIVLKPVGA